MLAAIALVAAVATSPPTHATIDLPTIIMVCSAGYPIDLVYRDPQAWKLYSNCLHGIEQLMEHFSP